MVVWWRTQSDNDSRSPSFLTNIIFPIYHVFSCAVLSELLSYVYVSLLPLHLIATVTEGIRPAVTKPWMSYLGCHLRVLRNYLYQSCCHAGPGRSLVSEISAAFCLLQVNKLQKNVAEEYLHYRNECDARKLLLADLNEMRSQQLEMTLHQTQGTEGTPVRPKHRALLLFVQ